MNEVLKIYGIILDMLLNYWWLILPVVLFFILRFVWLNYIRSEYLKNLKWVLLEVKISREIIKTPKAMENFFSGLHSIKKDPDFKEKYFKGMFCPWLILEIVSKGGFIHFYIKTEERFRNLIESQIFAQYPQVEITEVDDYIVDIPKGIPNKDYDAIVLELILVKEDAYPIKTYPAFFEEKEAEERTDPLSALFEFLNTLNSQENVALHFLISPTGDDWKKEGEKLVAKMLGKKTEEKKKSVLKEEIGGWAKATGEGISEFFFGPGGKGEEKKESESAVQLSPGEREIVSAVEKNISKLGFKTIIRLMYWAPKDGFSKDRITALGGFFTQFNTQNLNGFKPNKAIFTKFKVFKKTREENQKRLLVETFRKRKFPFGSFKTRGFIFNTEELATVFHIPGKFVEIEKMEKIGAKKGGPPSGLPIEE